jgi:hypothetical protein
MQVLYLHGFASSPRSSKATFFAAKLAARGISVTVPDLNQPDFSTLTVSRMLGRPLSDRPALARSRLGSSLAGSWPCRPSYPDRITRLAPGAGARHDGNVWPRAGDRGLDVEVVESATDLPLRPDDGPLRLTPTQYNAFRHAPQPAGSNLQARHVRRNGGTLGITRPGVELHMLTTTTKLKSLRRSDGDGAS